MRTQRIHISGGDAASHLALRRGEPRAADAVGASLGVSQRPRNDNGRILVGVDMSGLANADGTAPKVEWLPLTGQAGTDIAAAATSDFILTPTKYARPGALVIADTIAANLVMTNLLIGGKPVFAGSGAVPCILFSHLCMQNALSSYIATNSAPITFTLKNVHASATQTVRGVWVCDTQELAVG